MVDCGTHCAKRTAGVKLCPSRSVVGIESYQLRYLVYTSRRRLLVTGVPGEYKVYSALWTISESSQNVL